MRSELWGPEPLLTLECWVCPNGLAQVRKKPFQVAALGNGGDDGMIQSLSEGFQKAQGLLRSTAASLTTP
jgi:hypothetical protein